MGFIRKASQIAKVRNEKTGKLYTVTIIHTQTHK